MDTLVKKKDKCLLLYDQLKVKNSSEWQKILEDKPEGVSKKFQRAASKKVLTLDAYEEGLIKKERDPDQEALSYHRMSLRVMAKCCDGKNHISEASAQLLVPAKLCFAILNDPKVDPLVKASYSEFLFSVWWEVDRPDESLTPDFWKLIKYTPFSETIYTTFVVSFAT